MAGFNKSLNCPTSDQLLAFHTGNCTEEQRREVAVHINGCDFCGAEVDLYRHVPATLEEQEFAEKIPSHLYQLADALLNNRSSGDVALKTLLTELARKERDLV